MHIEFVSRTCGLIKLKCTSFFFSASVRWFCASVFIETPYQCVDICIYSFFSLFLDFPSKMEFNCLHYTHTLTQTHAKNIMFEPFIHCTPVVFATDFIIHEYAVIVWSKTEWKTKWTRKQQPKQQQQQQQYWQQQQKIGKKKKPYINTIRARIHI